MAEATHQQRRYFTFFDLGQLPLLGLRASATYAGEEQRPQGGVDNVQDLVTDEDAEDGEEQQHDQTHKQHSPAGSEVILALQ